MALIIKGDMPTKECLNCFDCQYLNLGETSYSNNRQSYRVGCVLAKFLGLTVLVKNSDELHSRPSDCPIIGEIPDKHGDLIDRKETRKQILEDLSKMKINLPFDVFGLIIDSVDFLLTKAPTIVEATE